MERMIFPVSADMPFIKLQGALLKIPQTLSKSAGVSEGIPRSPPKKLISTRHEKKRKKSKKKLKKRKKMLTGKSRCDRLFLTRCDTADAVSSPT